MISVVAFFAGFCLLSAWILAACARKSVQGYQDETGFQIEWHNNRPDLADISCIWPPVGNNRA